MSKILVYVLAILLLPWMLARRAWSKKHPEPINDKVRFKEDVIFILREEK